MGILAVLLDFSMCLEGLAVCLFSTPLTFTNLWTGDPDSTHVDSHRIPRKSDGTHWSTALRWKESAEAWSYTRSFSRGKPTFMNGSCGVHLGKRVHMLIPAERICPLQWVQLDPLKWCYYRKIDIENGKCPMPGLIDFGCQRVVGNIMIPVGAKMIKMSCSCCRQGWHVWHGSLPFLSVPAYHACHISRAPKK